MAAIQGLKIYIDNENMKHSIWRQISATWSTHSIWLQKVVIRSTSFFDIQNSPLKLNLKYSIWNQKSDLWSTPFDNNSRPYGMLHRALKTSLIELFMFLSQ